MTERQEPYNINDLLANLDDQQDPIACCPKCAAATLHKVEIRLSTFEGYTITVMRCETCQHVWSKVVKKN